MKTLFLSIVSTFFFFNFSYTQTSIGSCKSFNCIEATYVVRFIADSFNLSYKAPTFYGAPHKKGTYTSYSITIDSIIIQCDTSLFEKEGLKGQILMEVEHGSSNIVLGETYIGVFSIGICEHYLRLERLINTAIVDCELTNENSFLRRVGFITFLNIDGKLVDVYHPLCE